jgi:exopolysaccharide biosynthesis WecB/TagA/CpsF family protein
VIQWNQGCHGFAGIAVDSQADEHCAYLMRFLGIHVEAVSPEEAESVIVSHVEGAAPGTVVIHANLNTAHSSIRDAGLRQALEFPGNLVLFEGIGLKVAHWLTSGEWRPDANGTDLVPAVLRKLAHRSIRVVLVGGHDGVAAAAAEEMHRRFPHVQVVGAWNGYGDRRDEAQLLGAIAKVKPDIVLLGLGTPLQEPLAVAWSAQTGAKVTWAVGGLLDYLAGVRCRAPWMLRLLRLEWLWRLALYPSTYGRRYVLQGMWLLGQVCRIWTSRWTAGAGRSSVDLDLDRTPGRPANGTGD